MKKNHSDDKKEMSFLQKLYFKLDIPPDLTNGNFVEIRGSSNVCIHGCKKILLYTTEEVRVRLTGCILCVVGTGLYCTAYHAGVIEIDGLIHSVSYSEDK